MLPEIEHHFINTNGIKLHVAQTGPRDGQLVILLHGFPEFWYGWRHQIQPLTEAGYRLWIPDQRGYNLSDKPYPIKAYNLDALASDIAGLIKASGREQAIVVGHDWGAAVAWWLASRSPKLVQKLVVLNVPHPHAMQEHLKHSWKQRWMSKYIAFFQLPVLPEMFCEWNNWKGLQGGMESIGLPTSFEHADWRLYREAWSQPWAIRSMINWYRALVSAPPKYSQNPRIKPPTLLIWGMQDGALDSAMAQPSIDLCDNGSLALLPNASHWVQHDEPDEVNRLILDFVYNPPAMTQATRY